jgi:flagellar biosynthesis/type III secretory pathway protein FliH
LRTIPHVTEFAKSHHAQGLAEGKAEGLAEGKAEAVLAVLAARGIELTAEQRHRVQHGASPADLDKWLGQAATAHSADEVFA